MSIPLLCVGGLGLAVEPAAQFFSCGDPCFLFSEDCLTKVDGP
jgi:hypothetical protein